MSGHLSAEENGRYLGRTMSPAELLDADDHLTACEACRRALRGAAAGGAARPSLHGGLPTLSQIPPGHLTYEQLAAYVDDESGAAERVAVEHHLSVCSSCKEEVRDLFAFKESLAAAPAQVIEPTPAVRATGHFAAFWHRLWHTNSLRLAGTAAVILLIVGAALWLFFNRTRTGLEELAEVRPTPAPTISPRSPGTTPTPDATPKVEVADARPTPTPARTPAGPISPPETTQPEATTVLALNDGSGRVTLDSRGRVEGLGALSPTERQAVRSALANQRVEPPAYLADLQGKDGTLMGAPGAPAPPAFALESPVGRVVRAEAPTFRWSPLEGAASYTVNVYDSDFNKVATSPALGVTEWTVERPLARGRLYSWQVTASKEGQEIRSPAPPAPEAKFRILDDALARTLAQAEERHAGSHLTLGVLYARAGLLDEAEREFRALAAANPDSAAAQKLMNSVQKLRQGK